MASARLHKPHIFLGGPVIDRHRVTALFRHRSTSPLWETSDAIGVALHPRPYPQGAKSTGGFHLRGYPSPLFSAIFFGAIEGATPLRTWPSKQGAGCPLFAEMSRA